MIVWFRRLGALILLASLTACQSAPQVQADPSLDSTNSAQLVVYRTSQSFHSMNPEKPFVYLDDQHIGNLGTGDVITRQVKSGPHHLTMRHPVMFMPAWQIGALDLDLLPGKTYYVRYSYDMAGMVGTTPTGASSLSLVDAADGQARR